jgi:hypothetical protein
MARFSSLKMVRAAVLRLAGLVKPVLSGVK